MSVIEAKAKLEQDQFWESFSAYLLSISTHLALFVAGLCIGATL